MNIEKNSEYYRESKLNSYLIIFYNFNFTIYIEVPVLFTNAFTIVQTFHPFA